MSNAGTGLTEPLWIALVLAVTGEGLTRDQLSDRVAGALNLPSGEAHVERLIAAGLTGLDDHDRLSVSDGRRLYDQVRARTEEVTTRLWGDLPEQDLAVTARVLNTVLE